VLDVPDPNVIVGIECEPLPVEMIMRGYVTGVTSTSIWTHYAAGSRSFCGHELPEGLKKNERSPSRCSRPAPRRPRATTT
jgi:phosphoribosylaminoimidazole-succinocarboxamide synthase